MRVIGYAYDAAEHCTACASDRFGASALDDCTAMDSEGNDVHAIFSTDERDDSNPCGTCGDGLE